MKAVLARTSSMLGIFALAAGILAVACSAPPAGSIGSGEQDQTDDGDKKLPASSTSPTTPAPSNNNSTPGSTNDPAATPAPTPATPAPDGGVTPAPSPADQQCAAAADMFACFDCCDAAHPGGWEVAEQAWDDCVCQTACAQACGGNFCQGGQPSAACEQCLDNAQQCDDAANTACAANANCAAADACSQASACESKPDQ